MESELKKLTTNELEYIAKNVGIPLYSVMTKKQLISALNVTQEFSIGWRWGFMKPQLEKKEYRNAMELLLSPVRNISTCSKIRNFLKKHKVHISLTTSPLRLRKILAVLATLDLTYVENINVVLPYKYGRNQESYNKDDITTISKFPKVRIVRTDKDYGPITKMLPVIRKINDPQAIIISIDDDIGYPLGMVNEFLYNKIDKYPDAVIESSDEGQDFRNNISNFKRIFPRKVKPKKPFVDMVEGWLGVAYSKKLVNDEEMEKIANLSKECLLSDDLAISYILAKHNVPIVKIKNKYIGNQMSYLYGAGEDALHKGGGFGKVKVGHFSDEFNMEKYEICLYDIKRYYK